MDGTLCDSSALHYRAWSLVARQIGAPVPSWRDYVEQCLRGQRRFEDLLDLGGPARQGGLYERKSRLFREMAASELRPLPGVVELWARARALGLGVAVVSTARRDSVAAVMESLGLPAPDVMVGREDVEPRVKPDPAGYRRAAEMLGLSPARCVVFEDSPPGIQAAVAAETPCLAMASSIFTAAEQAGALLRLATLHDVELAPSEPGVAWLRARGT